MTRESLPRRVALTGALLLTVFACRAADLAAPRSTLSPGAPTAQRDDRGRRDRHRGPGPVGCDPRVVITTSAVIGPRGGTLRFGGSRLIVPAGALHESVRITATTRGDASATVDFLPEGLRFRRPAGLVLSADGCDTPDDGTPSVVYLGPGGEILETIAATFNRRWNEVAAPIQHFSGYAIAF